MPSSPQCLRFGRAAGRLASARSTRFSPQLPIALAPNDEDPLCPRPSLIVASTTLTAVASEQLPHVARKIAELPDAYLDPVLRQQHTDVISEWGHKQVRHVVRQRNPYSWTEKAYPGPGNRCDLREPLVRRAGRGAEKASHM